nr:hypothetical protein [Candidatus Sigynarchaeota archaeon]
MSLGKRKNIAIVLCGMGLHPFVEYAESTSFEFSYAFNNACDFRVEHKDRTKFLHFHLELFNLIEYRIRQFPSMYDALVSLSAAFNSFNPLHVHPVINLLGNYSTRFTKDAGISHVWNELLHPFFRQEQVFPLFDKEEPITITQGDVTVPVRQFLLLARDASGIPFKVNVDMASLKSIPLCKESATILHESAGLLILPMDVLSMSILFQSKQFMDFLEKYPSKV